MKTRNFSNFLKSLVIGIGAMLLVASVVYAATTIGSNINTTGTLNSTGLATFTTVTSTSATTTDYLYVGHDITQPAGWNFSQGSLIVSGNAFFNKQATSSISLWLGAGGTANNLNLSGGDLYVQDSAEIDGSLWVVNATTTDSVYVGGYASSTGGLFTQGKLWIGGNATTSNRLTIGSTYPTTNDKLYVGGTASIIGNSTTTGQSVSIGTDSITATTSIKLKSATGSTGQSCLEMTNVEGVKYQCYITGEGNLTCVAGGCE